MRGVPSPPTIGEPDLRGPPFSAPDSVYRNPHCGFVERSPTLFFQPTFSNSGVCPLPGLSAPPYNFDFPLFRRHRSPHLRRRSRVDAIGGNFPLFFSYYLEFF